MSPGQGMTLSGHKGATERTIRRAKNLDIIIDELGIDYLNDLRRAKGRDDGCIAVVGFACGSSAGTTRLGAKIIPFHVGGKSSRRPPCQAPTNSRGSALYHQLGAPAAIPGTPSFEDEFMHWCPAGRTPAENIGERRAWPG